jgi:CDP-glucose 4,6-dehydratase
LVRAGYQDPVGTYETNVMGAVHLLESIRECASVRSVVVVTTDKCYQNQEWDWGYRENEPMGGYDPYSNSKGCAELVVSGFHSSYYYPERYDDQGVGIAAARAHNIRWRRN